MKGSRLLLLGVCFFVGGGGGGGGGGVNGGWGRGEAGGCKFKLMPYLWSPGPQERGQANGA